MKKFLRQILIITTLMAFVAVTQTAALAGAGPRVLVTDADRAAVLEKIKTQSWARDSYAALKARVDDALAHVRADPQWLVSRLFMHWKTHATTALVEKSRWVGAEGNAPVPTVRFAGARDWVTTHVAPPAIDDLRPFNDNADGTIWLINKETGKWEQVAAGITGRVVEITNARVMQLAADAAFVYWLTGDEAYARMAADVLCTYMDGFAHTLPPRILDAGKIVAGKRGDGGAGIIGTTSFEVIHEEILPPLGLAFDFLHDYLAKNGRTADTALIQAQFKRMIDRIVDGGSAWGNWNLNQTWLITYASLALDNDTAFADGRGREHYASIILDADLPHQRGLRFVIRDGYDAGTALWPEAAGYGFGMTPIILQIASLLASDPKGSALLNDPILMRAIFAQNEFLHPNGWSTGLGDTYQTRINATALELMIARARATGDAANEEKLIALLRREIAAGQYRRDKLSDILPLVRYVGELKPATALPSTRPSRAFFAKPLNAFFQRNYSRDGNAAHALGAVLYGTDGGHVHANGLAVELYGAGIIQGADPGRGSSYWQTEHGEYYSQPPAHNTVIVNGRSNYPAHGQGHIPMRLDHAEPAGPDARALSPNISYAQASFAYETPVAAEQQRTLALIGTGAGGGFYFDVFRSRASGTGANGAPSDEFHDYLYHNVGDSLALSGVQQPLQPTNKLAPDGENFLKGYGYFKNPRLVAAPRENAFCVTFTVPALQAKAAAGGAPHSQMNVFMPPVQNAERLIFAVEAPPSHTGRDSMPARINEMPMPTLIVRQKGEAWKRPFVAVYEPVEGDRESGVKSVRYLNPDAADDSLVACVVSGRGFEARIALSDVPGRVHTIDDGASFQGVLCVRVSKVSTAGSDADDEIYLGQCAKYETPRIVIESVSGAPVDVSLRSGLYSASGPIRITDRKTGKTLELPAASDARSGGLHPPDEAEGLARLLQEALDFKN